MKTCTHCHMELSDDNFYKDKRVKSGLYAKCKDCHNKLSDRTKMLRYYNGDKSLLSSQPVKHRRAIDREEQKRRREIRGKCKNTARYAVKSGKIQKQKCTVCGSDAEMHHPDYNFPLSVVWLCRKHHARWHRRHEPIYPL